MKISVVGAGYVGLVTGVVFSDLGNDVMCVDRDEVKIRELKSGFMPIYEPGLEEIVRRNSANGRLRFGSSVCEATRFAEVLFICVGTPPGSGGNPDMSFIEAVAADVGRAMQKPTVIVNKSTVPVGTGDLVAEIIRKNQTTPVEFQVVSNPEFLREGSAIKDTLEPDRIVIGAADEAAAAKLKAIYAPLNRPVMVTDVASAEMIKYASNAFLATKISFANAIATLCDLTGADVLQVVKGVGADARIGPAFLNAGIGYGGSCFPKDTLALIATARKYGYDFDLLRSVVAINDAQPILFVKRIVEAFGGCICGKRFGILGLAFKANTDDMREAKALEVIRALRGHGGTVRAYDPVAGANAQALAPDLECVESAYEAAQDADALVVVTEWNEFKELDLERLRGLMRRPLICDARNLYDPAVLHDHGLEHIGIGRGTIYKVHPADAVTAYRRSSAGIEPSAPAG